MTDLKQKLEPAASVVESLGGATRVANELGTSRQNVEKWSAPKARSGRGGLIPSRYLAPLLDWIDRDRLPLTAEMLIRGVFAIRRKSSRSRR